MSSRPTTAHINLEHLAFNLKASRDFIGTAPDIMAVVKADAYGHGAVACARRLEAEGVDWLGVAIPEEAFELRGAGITTRILSLGGFWPGQEKELIQKAITPVIFSYDRARVLNEAARSIGEVVRIHIKVDTGMGRVGIRPDSARDFARDLTTLTNLKVDGILTHFPVADDLSKTPFTENQTASLNSVAEIFKLEGHSPTYVSLANSPGAIAHPSTRGNLVRLGGILYGLGGDVLPKESPAPPLKPVLSLTTAIASIKDVPQGEPLGYGMTFITERDSRIALIPIGYHDGLPRALSNQGAVLVRGIRVPIVGRVSMDWTIIDVTEVPDVRLDEQVVVIGDSGDERIRAEDLAMMTGTISYEITCGIGARVPRVYDSRT